MAIGALTEEIAENLEEVAEVTRKLDTRALGFLFGGIGIGVAVGFYLGHRYNREKIRKEAFEESEKEVAQIREVYMQKTMVADKPALEEVIEEAGYGKIETHDRPLPAPVPIHETIRPVLEEVEREEVESSTDHHGDWIYPRELEQRSPEHPYVIHEDEFAANEMEYDHVAYTYYAADDVLCDEDEKPLVHADQVVGQANLKFGHGSEDPNVVFIRNDRLTLEAEITRTYGSYEQEVMGLEHSNEERSRRQTKKRNR